MSVFAYIRVSTQVQTYASQRHEIEKWCRNNNVVVTEWVTESVSGTVIVEKRTLGALLERMDTGDVLICTELSRLGRNMLMIMGILNACASKGISIHSIKDRFDLTDNINSKIIAFAFALAAEIERTLISQRTKEALATKRSEGVRLGRPPGKSTKKLSFCNEWSHIKEMKASGMSQSAIARSLGIHRNTLKRYINEIELGI